MLGSLRTILALLKPYGLNILLSGFLTLHYATKTIGLELYLFLMLYIIVTFAETYRERKKIQKLEEERNFYDSERGLVSREWIEIAESEAQLLLALMGDEVDINQVLNIHEDAKKKMYDFLEERINVEFEKFFG